MSSSPSRYALELRCAEALAREAGQRIEIERREGFRVDTKGHNDLVTDVDRSIEQFLRAQLATLFPNDGIHGEEYGAEESPPARQWLIDPIDGTTNFSQGIPIYCVSIALQLDDETIVGAIYDPTRDELFSAAKGDGARLDGAPMTPSDETDLDDAVIVTGFPPIKEDDTFEKIMWRFGHMARASRGIRRLGSAALDLAYVAAGRIDGFWEYNLHSWDTAAGYLLVQEAGGRVTDALGGHYTAHEASVVATNGAIHDAILQTLADAKISMES